MGLRFVDEGGRELIRSGKQPATVAIGVAYARHMQQKETKWGPYFAYFYYCNL